MSSANHYMNRALELAKKGFGSVSPNPMVGCVIVHHDTVIGEGYHERYGGPHAEVNAVNSVLNKELIKESTVYVTLEPCSHYGKTPPCAKLLQDLLPQEVVIGSLDPNPLVAGRGINMLKEVGIQVTSGILDKENKELNKRFFTFHTKKRPYVILKWAQTEDGFIAKENFDSKWISCKESRTIVHQWRAEEDAIMVGKNTALHDNPYLNVRFVEGKNPIRIVFDARLSLPKSLNLFDQSQPTIVYNGIKEGQEEQLQYVKIDTQAAYIDEILADLADKQISSIIIEGGSRLLNGVLDAGLWDEARVFIGNKLFLKGIEAPKISKSPENSSNYYEDKLLIYKN